MPRTERIRSVDLIRGAVMLLMAIDHVRVYSGLPPGGPSPGIFLTRWVTHFCAPAFVFLAGTSAFLYARRVDADGGDGRAALTRFLLTRGAWLVFLELTVLRLAWSLDIATLPHAMAGVIWMLGWCMILLAALVRLPLGAIAALGVAVIALHNAVGPAVPSLVPALAADWSWLWRILYRSFHDGPIALGDNASLVVLYSIVPWIGVMAAGYAFGALLTLPPERRDMLCRRIGLGAIALFVLLRATDIYGDPQPWRESWLPAPLAFLETTKYPASLSFLLMTLGPTVVLIPWLERARGWVTERVAVFGRVPFLYYLLHIPVIHALAIAVSLWRTGHVDPWLFANHPMGASLPPDGYAWTLGTLYAVWAVSVAVLYVPCQRFAAMRARSDRWWVRYL